MQKDYFNNSKFASSLFLQAESDGDTDGKKSKLPLGLATIKKGQDVFVPKGERSGFETSIELEGFARFEDEHPDVLNFSQYSAESQYYHGFDHRDAALDSNGINFQTETQWQGYVPKPHKTSKSISDKWTTTDVKIVDDVAVVSYEDFSDVHRIDIDLDDLKFNQFWMSADGLTARYSSQLASQGRLIGSLSGRTFKLGYMDKRNYSIWTKYDRSRNDCGPDQWSYNFNFSQGSWNIDAFGHAIKQMNASFEFADFYDSFIRIDFGDFVGYFAYGGPVENTIQHEIPGKQYFDNLLNHYDLKYSADESSNRRSHQNGTLSMCDMKTGGSYHPGNEQRRLQDRDISSTDIEFKDGTIMGEFYIVAGSIEQENDYETIGAPTFGLRRPAETPAHGGFNDRYHYVGKKDENPTVEGNWDNFQLFPKKTGLSNPILNGPARGVNNQKSFTIQLSLQYNPSDTERFVSKESQSFYIASDRRIFNSNYGHKRDDVVFGNHDRVLKALEVNTKSIKFVKFKPVRGCGKVDIYQKKKGIVQYIKYNTITSPSHGLKTGDIIDISNALLADVLEGFKGYTDIHPINGRKYVKVIDANTFEIYDDQVFQKPTTTVSYQPQSSDPSTQISTEIRNVRYDASTTPDSDGYYPWVADDITYSPVGNIDSGESQSWSYYTSLYSPSGRNGYKFKDVEEQPFYSDQRLNLKDINMAQPFSVLANGYYFDDLYRKVPKKWSSLSSNIKDNFLNNPINAWWAFHDGMGFGSSIDARKKDNGDIEILVGEKGSLSQESLFDSQYFGKEASLGAFRTVNSTVLTTYKGFLDDDFTSAYAFDRKKIAPAGPPCGKVHKFTLARDTYKKITSVAHNLTVTGSDQKNPAEKWLNDLYNGIEGGDVYWQYKETYDLFHHLSRSNEDVLLGDLPDEMQDKKINRPYPTQYFKDFYWIRSATGMNITYEGRSRLLRANNMWVDRWGLSSTRSSRSVSGLWTKADSPRQSEYHKSLEEMTNNVMTWYVADKLKDRNNRFHPEMSQEMIDEINAGGNVFLDVPTGTRDWLRIPFKTEKVEAAYQELLQARDAYKKAREASNVISSPRTESYELYITDFQLLRDAIANHFLSLEGQGVYQYTDVWNAGGVSRSTRLFSGARLNSHPGYSGFTFPWRFMTTAYSVFSNTFFPLNRIYVETSHDGNDGTPKTLSALTSSWKWFAMKRDTTIPFYPLYPPQYEPPMISDRVVGNIIGVLNSAGKLDARYNLPYFPANMLIDPNKGATNDRNYWAQDFADSSWHILRPFVIEAYNDDLRLKNLEEYPDSPDSEINQSRTTRFGFDSDARRSFFQGYFVISPFSGSGYDSFALGADSFLKFGEASATTQLPEEIRQNRQRAAQSVNDVRNSYWLQSPLVKALQRERDIIKSANLTLKGADASSSQYEDFLEYYRIQFFNGKDDSAARMFDPIIRLAASEPTLDKMTFPLEWTVDGEGHSHVKYQWSKIREDYLEPIPYNSDPYFAKFKYKLTAAERLQHQKLLQDSIIAANQRKNYVYDNYQPQYWILKFLDTPAGSYFLQNYNIGPENNFEDYEGANLRYRIAKAEVDLRREIRDSSLFVWGKLGDVDAPTKDATMFFKREQFSGSLDFVSEDDISYGDLDQLYSKARTVTPATLVADSNRQQEFSTRGYSPTIPETPKDAIYGYDYEVFHLYNIKIDLGSNFITPTAFYVESPVAKAKEIFASRDAMCWVDGFGRSVSMDSKTGAFVASSLAVTHDMPQPAKLLSPLGKRVTGSMFRMSNPEKIDSVTSICSYDASGQYINSLYDYGLTNTSLLSLKEITLEQRFSEIPDIFNILKYRTNEKTRTRIGTSLDQLSRAENFGKFLARYSNSGDYNALAVNLPFRGIQNKTDLWGFPYEKDPVFIASVGNLQSISSTRDTELSSDGSMIVSHVGKRGNREGLLIQYPASTNSFRVKEQTLQDDIIYGEFNSFALLDNQRIIVSRRTANQSPTLLIDKKDFSDSVKGRDFVSEGGIEIYERNLSPLAGKSYNYPVFVKSYFGFSENITYDQTTSLTYDFFNGTENLFTCKMSAGKRTIGVDKSCRVPVLFFDVDEVNDSSEIERVEVTFDIIEEDIVSTFDLIKSDELGEPYTAATVSTDGFVPRLINYAVDPRKSIMINSEPNEAVTNHLGQSIERIWNSNPIAKQLYGVDKLPIAKNWSVKYSDLWKFSPGQVPIFEWYFQPKFRGGAQDLFFYNKKPFSETEDNVNNLLAYQDPNGSGSSNDGYLLIPPPAGPANPNSSIDNEFFDGQNALNRGLQNNSDFGLYPLGSLYGGRSRSNSLERYLGSRPSGSYRSLELQSQLLTESLGLVSIWPYLMSEAQKSNTFPIFRNPDSWISPHGLGLADLRRLYTVFHTDESGFKILEPLPLKFNSNGFTKANPYAKLYMPTAQTRGYTVTIDSPMLLRYGLQGVPRVDGNLHDGADFNDNLYLSDEYKDRRVATLAIGFLMTNYTEYSMEGQNGVQLSYDDFGNPQWSTRGNIDESGQTSSFDGVPYGVHTRYPSASVNPTDKLIRNDVGRKGLQVHHKKWTEITNEVDPKQIGEYVDNFGPLTAVSLGARYPYQNHCNFYNWTDGPLNEFPEHIWEGASIEYELSSIVKNIKVKVFVSKFEPKWTLVADDKDINYKTIKSHKVRDIAVERSGGSDDPNIDVLFSSLIDDDGIDVLGSFTVMKEDISATNTIPALKLLNVGAAEIKRINKLYQSGHGFVSSGISLNIDGHTGLSSDASIFIGQKIRETGVSLVTSAPDAIGDLALSIFEAPVNTGIPAFIAGPDSFAGMPLVADSPATSSVPLVSFGPILNSGGIPLSWVPQASGQATLNIKGIGGQNSGVSLQVDAVENVNNNLGLTFAAKTSGNITLDVYGHVPSSGSASLVMTNPFDEYNNDMFIKMISTHNSDMEGSPTIFIKSQRYFTEPLFDINITSQFPDSGNTTAYVSGPEDLNSDMSLALRSFYESGNATLVVKPIDRTPQAGTSLFLEDTYGVTSLHINQVLQPDMPIKIKGKPAIYKRGMGLLLDAAYYSNQLDTNVEGHQPISSTASLAFFDVTSGSGYLNVTSLFVGKEINSDSQASLFTYNDKYKPASDGTHTADGIGFVVSGGLNYGYSSLSDNDQGFTLRLNTVDKQQVTNVASLRVETQEPIIGGGGGYIESGNVTVVIAGNNDANVFYKKNLSTSLNIKNRDTQYGQAPLLVTRPEENVSSLFIKSYTDSDDLNVYISGANLGIGEMSTYISPPESKTSEFFTRGYSE